MTFGQNLKKARKDKKMTQKELALLISAKHNSISNWENDQNKPDPATIESICVALEIEPNFLFGLNEEAPKNIHPIPRLNQVPIIGRIACGSLKEAVQEADSFVSIEDMHADFALVADGDSMTGVRIHDGDIVLCREQPIVEQGEIAAVIIDDEATLKRFYRYGNLIVLRAENPAYDDIEIRLDENTEVHIIGKVVASIIDVF